MILKDEEITDLFFEVTRLNRRFSQQAYGAMTPYRGQCRCLYLLDALGAANQKDLAASLSVRPASASEILLKLEQKGLIRREKASADKRSVFVSLTEAGRLEVQKIRKDRAKFHSEMLRSLSREEKDCFYSCLQKIKNDYLSREKETRHVSTSQQP